MISAFWFLVIRIGRMGLVIMVMNRRVLQNKGLLTCFPGKVLYRAVGVACTALAQTWRPADCMRLVKVTVLFGSVKPSFACGVSHVQLPNYLCQ